MAIRLKPNGKFQVDVTVKGQPRFVQTVSSEEEAKDIEKQKIEELRFGVSSKPTKKGVWTLGEAFSKTCSIVWDGSKAEASSIRNAKQAIKFFGGLRPLDSIDTDLVDDYVDWLKAIGNSGATINRKLAALSKMMTVAVQRGHLASKPHIPRKKESEGRIRFITHEEEAKMLQLAKQWGMDDFYDVVITLIDTGLRVGELRKMSMRDINFTSGNFGTVSVWESKNTESRTIPITSRVAEILARRKGEFNFSKDWLRTPWDKMKGVMGLADDDQFVPHTCRHTCASRLVIAGVDLVRVQEWLGHKSILVTRRYSHLAPTNLMDAVMALEPTKLTVLRKAN